MENTRFMSRMFSAVNEGDEELVNQVDNDIKDAEKNGSVENDEITIVSLGEGKFEVTDNENGEQTIVERAEDDAYDMYPANIEMPTEQIEGYAHPEGDGVTPGDQEGAPDEDVNDHDVDETLPPTVDENAEGEDDVCPECGCDPCECEDDEEEKEFSVSTDNTVVQRIFSDQIFCERIFSEVIESEDTAQVGSLKIEKVADEDNAVVVTDTNTGDQAKVTMDEDEMDVQELDSKNFSEEGQETDNEEEFMPLHVVGIDTFNHQLVDACEYSEESAQELVARLQECGVDAVQIFDNEEEARDYAISLLEGLDAESYDEPEQVEFSEHDLFITPFYSESTNFMTRMFSEACNDIDATQETIEDAIKDGEETETDTEIITPIDDETVIVEDKDNGELTKVVVSDDDLECTPISEEEADELKADIEDDDEAEDSDDDDDDEDEEKTYCNHEETKFFSEDEIMTNYMCRLFSDEASDEDIEKAIEDGEQVETENEIITPVDDETAVIEDKENGEYTKATMTDDDIEVVPISEEEATDLTSEKTYCNHDGTKQFSEGEIMTDYMCKLFADESDANEDDIEQAIEDGEVVETSEEVITPVDDDTAIIEDKESGEYTKATINDGDIECEAIDDDEAEDMIDAAEEEKKYSGNYVMDRFFAEVAQSTAPETPEVVPAVYDENGNLVPVNQEEEGGAPSVEAIEDAALAAVQAIQNAATESTNAIMTAKNTPSTDEQAELQEAQFSERYYSDTEDTLISWLENK